MVKIKFFIGYYIYNLMNFLIPKNSRYVFLFDKKHKKDSVWTIAKTLAQSEGEEYSIFYYTKDKINTKDIPSVTNVNNKWIAFWYQCRSKFIFYSYRNDGYRKIKSYRNQIIIDTTHGTPLKKIGYLDKTSSSLIKYEDTFDFIICQSNFGKKIIKDAFGATEQQCLLTGLPRNDELFKENGFKIFEEIHYSKLVIWMPTWRQGSGVTDIIDSEVQFPILTSDNIGTMDEFLTSQNILLIIKPHPYQKNNLIFHNHFTNIKIIDNEYLFNKGITLYELLGQSDALLTDYSSVYFDYLLLDRPIGFTSVDYDSYNQNRGFVVNDPEKIMPGDHIRNFESLIVFLKKISSNQDEFSENRKAVSKIVNEYNDPYSTERMLAKLGIILGENKNE